MYGIIYRIFNIKNGKSYIGKTYSTFYDRLQSHLYDKDRYPTRPLYRALNKYGPESFSAEILGEFPQGLLESKEKEFIQLYRSYGSAGYNATLGGDGRALVNLCPQEVRNKYLELKTISATASFYDIDLKTCKNLLGDIIDNSLFDIKSERRKRLSKRVLIKDIDLIFDNPYECARFLIDNGTVNSSISERNVGLSIARACKHRHRTYKGLSFTYID
jgi:group I intron endonuclease